MQKITLTVGIPASLKTTWAKEEISKDPTGTVRVSRDDLRIMMNNYTFSDSNEKLITKVRDSAILAALKSGRNVIVDETGLNPKHFKDMCKLAQQSGIECMILEKPFYVDLEEAIERNSKRTGYGKIPEEVIHQMWKKSGKEGHKHYKPRVEIINGVSIENNWELLKQDENLSKAIICDLDGTVANLLHRSPYDASKCLDDKPIEHVIELVKLFYSNGHKIIFCSGREDKFRDLTTEWLNKYIGIEYELFMRPTANFQKDAIIKENIFNTEIKNKYNIKAVIDDRLQVCQLWYKLGLPLFRVGDPESSF